MSTKTLLMILLSLIIAFVIVIGGFLTVYKLAPGWIGLEKPSVTYTKSGNQKKYYKEPVISLKKSEFDEMQNKIIRVNLLEHQIITLTADRTRLADTITKLGNLISSSKTSLPNMQDSISNIHKNTANLRDSLAKLGTLYAAAVSERDAARKTMDETKKNMLGTTDSVKNKSLSEFAKIYDNSEPNEVAKILEKIDTKDASKILKLMSKKKAGKVLDVMNPDKVAEIMKKSGVK
jgi:flagellar motility protein MotE (MotC chaperone)